MDDAVLLVGGSSEIGYAVLTEIAGPAPRRVILAGRPSAQLWHNADQLRDLGYQVSTVPYDASMSPAGVDALVGHVIADHPLGTAILAVGAMHEPDSDTSGSFHESLTVNGTAPAVLIQALLCAMRRSGSGRLVLISSAAAARPRRAILAYSLGKQLADTAALLLTEQSAADGVRVLVVRPGFVTTRMTTGLRRPPLATTPPTVARAVSRALRGRRRVVWVPRSMAPVVWLLRFVPGPLLPSSLR